MARRAEAGAWEDLEPALVPAAALRSVTKSFGGTVAVRDVSLELHPGEVLALLGENGAGKSTCVKLLAGVHRPDTGEVLLAGEPVHLHAPLDAQRRGVAVMHQHPGLFPDLAVEENLLVGHEQASGLGLLDRARMRRESLRLLDLVGLACRPDTPLRQLRSSEQQLVEIARALSINARVLIMDEPTAALSLREVDRLFGVVDRLRGQGVAMMFVGHRMDEIYRVADRVTVLRDGRLVATAAIAEMPRERAIQLMVGRALGDMYPARAAVAGQAGAGGERPGARRRLHRDLLRRAGRRGPGLRRPGRKRPHRDRAHPVRRRPGHRRQRPARRPRGRLRRARRRHGGRSGLCFGGPDRPEPGDGLLDPGQRLAADDRPGDDRRADSAQARAGPGSWPSRAAAAALLELSPAGQDAVRRQPAEGRAGEVARDQPAPPDPGRADPGHRRPDQGRGPRRHRRSRPARPGHHPDLFRAARAPGHVRPDRRAARGQDHRRAGAPPRPRRNACSTP